MIEQQPAFDSETARQLHEALLAQLTHDGLLADQAIADAFRATPRHYFLPGHSLEEVYADKAIAVKRDGDDWLSSSSQPAMMAIMLAQLGLAPGQRVLEIGAGTGYNAALLSRIVGPSGRVISIDLDADLVEMARAHLAAAGVGEVELRAADGARGAPDAAPFDRIIVTVGAWDLLPAWRAQLAPSGRIVLPITLLPGQMFSLALERRNEHWETVSARPCGFLPMRGSEAHPQHAWGGLRITVHPRDERTSSTRAAAILDKEWSQIELRWG
jgi:protein-L-isoaspartate(D-aspartate) O-methyltransferase